MEIKDSKKIEKVKGFGVYLGTLWVDNVGSVDFFEYKNITWGLCKNNAFFANQLGEFQVKHNGVSKEIEYIDSPTV